MKDVVLGLLHAIRLTGEVKVNGEQDIRNKRKLYAGDVVEYQGKRFDVKGEEIR